MTNRPVNFNDPTGHKETTDTDGGRIREEEPCLVGDLACQMEKSGYKPKPKEKVIKELMGDAPQFFKDARETCIESPIAGCPPVTSFFPSLSERAAWTIEHGLQIIGTAMDKILDIFRRVNVVTPQVTPTHYFVSPTVPPTSTLILPNATATITPYYTPTVTMTFTVSPTPSAILLHPTGTFTSIPPTPTPQYRVP